MRRTSDYKTPTQVATEKQQRQLALYQEGIDKYLDGDRDGAKQSLKAAADAADWANSKTMEISGDAHWMRNALGLGDGSVGPAISMWKAAKLTPSEWSRRSRRLSAEAQTIKREALFNRRVKIERKVMKR